MKSVPGVSGRGSLVLFHRVPQLRAAFALDPRRQREGAPPVRLETEDLDHLEEGRGGEGAGQGEAHRLGEVATLEARLGGEGARGLLDRGVREGGEGRDPLDEGLEERGVRGLAELLHPATSYSTGSSP